MITPTHSFPHMSAESRGEIWEKHTPHHTTPHTYRSWITVGAVRSMVSKVHMFVSKRLGALLTNGAMLAHQAPSQALLTLLCGLSYHLFIVLLPLSPLPPWLPVFPQLLLAHLCIHMHQLFEAGFWRSWRRSVHIFTPIQQAIRSVSLRLSGQDREIW